MALSTKPYKGTRDFYPEEMRRFRWVMNQLREVSESYGFQEYDGPMLEPFELYAAKTGEEIVNKQLYWLIDRGERKLAIRPEMTPTMARMVAQKVMELPKPIRWFSIPNLWRYERPQRGRLREHWQLNCDILGGDPILADQEILALSIALIRKLKGEDQIEVRVNHRGLMDHFFGKVLKLSDEQSVKITKLIDAKDKLGEEKYETALSELGIQDEALQKVKAFFNKSLDQICREFPCEGVQHLKAIVDSLRRRGLGQSIKFDASIMRGMDYYTGLVFEIYDISPKNNRAMFGGGRYDNLIGLFGKQKLSGIGFGMGDVTIQDFLETHGLMPKFSTGLDAFVTIPKIELHETAEEVASQLRGAGLNAMTPLEVGGFSHQLKLASKHGAEFVVLLGEDELKGNKVAVKQLSTGKQETVEIKNISKWMMEKKT